MESKLEEIKDNIKLWNSKVLKVKGQQEMTKKYLTNSISNLKITNERLQKMEIFMANAHANPKFINQIMAQHEKKQELSKDFPFTIPTLKLLSKKTKEYFVYTLFEMVNDPAMNSVVIWSKAGTSFFIKDTEGLQDHVQERFKHTTKTFYKRLSEFGFRCVDRFLCEYTNENFQRDNNHMLKYITSTKKLLAVKKIMQSDMEEELKRLKFFQNELKGNISNIKKKEQITKCDMLNVKSCLENASKRIAQTAKGETRVGLPSVDSQPQAYEKRKLKQDDGRQPWLRSTKSGVNAGIEKIKQELYQLNVQMLNIEQGYMFIEDQLAAIERTFPSTVEKLEEIKSSMNKLFAKPTSISTRKRSRQNENNKNLESGTKKAPDHSSESPNQAMNGSGNDHTGKKEELAMNGSGNDHTGKKEELATNFKAQELNNIFNYLTENDDFSDTGIKHDDLTKWTEILEGLLTSS